MTIDKMVSDLIEGKTVIILGKKDREEIQARLRQIKKNCTIVLAQLNDKTL